MTYEITRREALKGAAAATAAAALAPLGALAATAAPVPPAPVIEEPLTEALWRAEVRALRFSHIRIGYHRTEADDAT